MARRFVFVMARLVRATRSGTVLVEVARTSRAMTKTKRRAMTIGWRVMTTVPDQNPHRTPSAV
jgi:hypothetical protein